MTLTNNNWRVFNRTSNEGFGTYYDRYYYERLFSRKIFDGIESVAQFPSFGMNGVTGLDAYSLVTQGKRVTIYDTDASRLAETEYLWQQLEKTKSIKMPTLKLIDNLNGFCVKERYDYTFSISAMWHYENLDIERYISNLANMSRRNFTIYNHNFNQIFYKIWSAIDHKDLNSIHLDNVNIKTIKSCLAHINCNVQIGYCITTPWPGIIKNFTGTILKKAVLDTTTQPTIPEYFDFHGRKRELMGFLYSLESLPHYFKKYWGHLISIEVGMN